MSFEERGSGALARDAQDSASPEVGADLSRGPATPSAASRRLRRTEYHAFQGAGAPYLYMVPSAAVVRLDEPSKAVLDLVESEDVEVSHVFESLVPRWGREDVKA